MRFKFIFPDGAICRLTIVKFAVEEPVYDCDRQKS